MDHFEMVEKLRQKANVSYEEAKEALEASDWDILDALVLLESEGKVNGGVEKAEYTTQEKKPDARSAQRSQTWESGWTKFWNVVKKLFQKGNANQFVIQRNGQELMSMPITVLVLIVLVLWPASLLVMFIALFFGARYSFRGPDISGKANDPDGKFSASLDVNAAIDRVQDKVAQVVEDSRDGENKAE